MALFTYFFGNTSLLFGEGPKKNKEKEVEVDSEPPTVNTIIPHHLNTPTTLKRKSLLPLHELGQLVGILPPFALPGASSQSPQPKNRKPKRKHPFSTGTQKKRVKKIPSEPATVILVDVGEASGEEAPLQRRKRSSPTQPNPQPGEFQNLSPDDVEALWSEVDLVENVDSRFPASAVIPSPRSSDPEPLLPPTIKQITTNTSPTSTVSHPSTPTTSRPSTPVSLSPLATTTSSPPATEDQERDSSPPHSPDHENLGHGYSSFSPNPRGRRSATLSDSKECHLLSKLEELANYLNPLALEKYWKKIRSLSEECLIRNAMHGAIYINNLKADLSSKTEEANAAEEQINNLKADLSSKTEEANDAEDKRDRMKERLKRAMDQNQIYSTTNVELDSRLSAMRSERDDIQVEIDRLQAKLQDQEDSLVY
ncbi:uncharacterized protein [Nicotiana tomentosiformis]|uniref:uncharacterized protein n=1 Tax=Nicotiana tomentosiformis TaxID=4098 RepID=UPI00388C7CD3